MPSDFQPEHIRAQIQSLPTVSSPMEAEQILATILDPLLAKEGYKLERFGRSANGDQGIDFTANRIEEEAPGVKTIGVQFKHYRASGRKIEIGSVREAIGAAFLYPFDRFLLISTTGFTKSALDASRRIEPVSIALLGPEELDEWVTRIQAPSPQNLSQVAVLVRTISHEFAVLVAHNGQALQELEWRDLERMMFRIMEGLGFKAILTPPSKDGGKDLILTCEISNEEHSYIVELKHWRSGKRVGSDDVKDFLNVIVTEKRHGGLFLSSSGYASGAFEQLTELERRQLRFGSTDKIITLAQSYVRADSGIWSPPQSLPELLFEGTL